MSEQTAVFESLLKQNTKDISADIKRLFWLAEHITFEVGMFNEFSIGLEAIITAHGQLALKHIQSLILKEKTSVSVAMEALRYIGNFESTKWHTERRQLLENCLLESRFAWVRDGASVGLSYLDDPQSIPVLETAIKNETNEELKEDLLQVLEQLEGTLLES